MTLSILEHLHHKITDALDGARGAGAALARSAHEVIDCAQPEPAPTAFGTSSRADLIDRETVRVLLTGANLSRIDGMLSAYGAVLRFLDDALSEGRSTAIRTIETEAHEDAKLYVTAVAEGETDTPEVWGAGAFDALISEGDPELGAALLSVIPRDEAQALFLAEFLRALKGAS
jgi:hypothetical protein